jgi:hypothetical protein
VIERRRRRIVKEAIVVASPHAFRGCRPPASGMASGLDDQPARLRVEFDFFGQIRFLEERLGNPDPPRIADLYDPRLRSHVITV